ncbi:hypothetical protein TeGR_g8198 [Tetraparma gracilis]|uniref:Uncharacterized protein n=1 Tax=Tetraparma gracilis TaxID=2962635 RepID=A0ABQ6MKH0_9STRA|nr:hypothetical protein TeGR_g8198 [Tetraparma gracilis]
MLKAISRVPARLSRGRGMSGFSFAGVKDLASILDMEKCAPLNGDEIATLWKEYHADKSESIGWVGEGAVGKIVLHKARSKNCKFFVAPVFDSRAEDPATAGYYNLIVQFFEPSHFVLADLNQYQQDPANTNPMLSFSVFDEFLESRNVALIRADVISKALEEEDAKKVIRGVLSNFDGRSLSRDWVDEFNNRPAEFDFDKYVALQRASWFSGEEPKP